MATTTGHRKLLEQLRADGMTTMFGNPGSSEEGLLDEVSRFPEIRYILGLQEAALVLMANGYALATQKPTVVQLHCSVGLGNAHRQPLSGLPQAARAAGGHRRRGGRSRRRARCRTWRSTSSPSRGR